LTLLQRVLLFFGYDFVSQKHRYPTHNVFWILRQMREWFCEYLFYFAKTIPHRYRSWDVAIFLLFNVLYPENQCALPSSGMVLELFVFILPKPSRIAIAPGMSQYFFII
jgi:hypothetical protein